MTVRLTDLLCEGNRALLECICNYWRTTMPNDNEAFGELRKLLKGYYTSAVEKAADIDLENLNIIFSQAEDFAKVCKEYDEKMSVYMLEHSEVTEKLEAIAKGI